MKETGSGNSTKPTSARAAILDAAIQVIVDSGPGSLTFRSVAAVAGVSLGTMTYHFPDKNDLLRTAIKHGRDATLRRDKSLLDGHLERHDLVDAIAHYIGELTQQPEDALLKAYRVYATALYFSDLRELVSPWHLESMLRARGYGDEIRNAALVGEGILLYALVNGMSFSVEETRNLIAPHLAPVDSAS